MKEMITAARNITITMVETKGGEQSKPVAIVECVLVMTEPQYRLIANEEDGGEDVVVQRVPESLRFGASPTVLRALSEAFTLWADEADEALARFGGSDAEAAAKEPT